MSQDHQTSAFMNANGGSFQDVTQPDAASAGRLLSTSGEDKRPRIRMTQPARRRVWLTLAITLIILILIAVVIIIAVTASTSNDDATVPSGDYTPHKVPHAHVRCRHDVIVAEKDSGTHWRQYDSNARTWKAIPSVENAGFVLISPRYKLEAGYPGVIVSMLLPRNNTHFHLMAVENKTHHSYPVTMATASNRCESVIIDDPKFFDGDEREFRIYVFYKSPIRFGRIKFTVTSLPTSTRFQPITIRERVTTRPEFAVLELGHHDNCSIEIKDAEHHCNWWNVNDGDNANFLQREESGDGCIDGGVRSKTGAVWFLSLESQSEHDEARALLVSPIIQRKTGSVLLTMWYMFKCDGPHFRIHLIPAGTSSFRHAYDMSTVVADVITPASHSDWKFLSFQIAMPDKHQQYHIVIEGIVPSKGNCSQFYCSPSDSVAATEATSPTLGIDSLSLELMHEMCPRTNHSIMDCKFETSSAEPTMCEWQSSLPPGINRDVYPPDLVREFQDWKTVNSGDGDDHGATSQHFEDRGYIMSFDASGRARSESHVRTPLLQAKSNCSCVMIFDYLMRGILTPRMQVNVIYGANVKDEQRVSRPQWSVLGHQGEDWKKAVIALNLKTGTPFQIEIRVLDISYSRGDVHFDDLYFSGCDMEKYVPS